MNLLYNILVFKAHILLWCIALFNKKIRLFVDGRKETFQKISTLKNQETVWFHVASLGEFEQARPIIEEVKNKYTNYKILVTFFSPSGYEIRKNYNLADVVCYLPLDSNGNAKEFLEMVNPKIAIFVKYEFWPNFLKHLKKKNIPVILVSGIFRPNQLFFEWYGAFMRKSLKAFHHFFVQNSESKELLKSIAIGNVTIAGDTRFDRVSKILEQDNTLDFIKKFTNNQYTIVAGSTWQEDEELLVNYINREASLVEKFIIAPHNIKSDAILALQKSINKKTILYSRFLDCARNDNNNVIANEMKQSLKDYQVFIVDTIGLLTKIYAAADVAYVGGGLKTGLHNILEPATFGIPVVIGNKFHKFKEAIDLVALKGCVSISNQKEFSSIFSRLKNNIDFRKQTGEINKQYIQQNVGATQKIINYLNTKL